MVHSYETKIDATDRLKVVSRSFCQLHTEKCVKVRASPFSEIHSFILEVIYSLQWGESSNSTSVISLLSDDINEFVGIIHILLDDHTDHGIEQPVIIVSKWTQRGSIVTAVNSCNYENEKTEEFTIPDYLKAATMLKRLVRDSVTYMAMKKLGRRE